MGSEINNNRWSVHVETATYLLATEAEVGDEGSQRGLMLKDAASFGNTYSPHKEGAAHVETKIRQLSSCLAHNDLPGDIASALDVRRSFCQCMCLH